MGKFDSSLTRVQPIFRALYEKDSSSTSWLRELLELGERAGLPQTVPLPETLGELEQQPCFEFPVDPPKALLRWLIEHPEKLSVPPEKIWNRWSERTRRKRQALLRGDGEAQEEAKGELEGYAVLPRRRWWRLEGVTQVDCALLTRSAVVFVEGKRTELGPSKNVLWYPGRNQVLRNLDCAAAFAQQTRRPHYFVLLVVDEELVGRDPDRQREIEEVLSSKTVEQSLPHLSNSERAELLGRYLGSTTWQAIVERLGLGDDVLLDA